jgi:hypothetical protein
MTNEDERGLAALTTQIRERRNDSTDLVEFWVGVANGNVPGTDQKPTIGERLAAAAELAVRGFGVPKFKQSVRDLTPEDIEIAGKKADELRRLNQISVGGMP